MECRKTLRVENFNYLILMQDLVINELGIVDLQDYPLVEELKSLMDEEHVPDLCGARLCS